MSDRPEFVSLWWRERIAALEEAFTDGIPDDFLSVPAVRDCGLVTENYVAAAEQHARLEWYAKIRPDLLYVLGSSGIVTPTDIAHLYHLHKAGWPKEPRGSLVEWGGGFGNMARITRLFPQSPTHIVVDVPVMQALQYVFLARIERRHESERREQLESGGWEPVAIAMSHRSMAGVSLATTGAAHHPDTHRERHTGDRHRGRPRRPRRRPRRSALVVYPAFPAKMLDGMPARERIQKSTPIIGL